MKGKKCGKGYVSAKKKCKSSARVKISTSGDQGAERRGRQRSGVASTALRIAVPALIGAAGIGLLSQPGDTPPANRRITPTIEGEEYIPEKASWVEEGSLPRHKVEVVLSPIEDRIQAYEEEWASLVDARTGRVILRPKTDGQSGGVNVPASKLRRGVIMTHNHPDRKIREGEWEDGGGLSPSDLGIVVRNQNEIRAVTGQWVYSFRIDWGIMDSVVEREARKTESGIATEELRRKVREGLGYDNIPSLYKLEVIRQAGLNRDRIKQGLPSLSAHEMSHKAMLSLVETYRERGVIYEAKRRKPRMDSLRMGICQNQLALRVCAEIRTDAKKTVANKGKKCPGGYWIPRKNECGGKKLSSSEGSDVRRKNRRNLALGLGVGLGGAALVGAGVAAAASRRGKKGESQGVAAGTKEGRGRSEGTSSPTESREEESFRKQLEGEVEWVKGWLEKDPNSGDFDEPGMRRLIEMKAKRDPVIEEFDEIVGELIYSKQEGREVDGKRLAAGIEKLKGKGVSTTAYLQHIQAVKQHSIDEVEFTREMTRDPSEPQSMWKRFLESSEEELSQISMIEKEVRSLFSRKDSLYSCLVSVPPSNEGSCLLN